MAQLRQEVDPGEAGLDAKALDRLDQHVAHYVDEGRLPGFLLAVAVADASPTSPPTAAATSRRICPSRPTPCGGSTP